LLPSVDSIRGACCRFCSDSAMLTVSSFRDVTTFTVYVTTCDFQKSLSFDIP